MRQKTIEQMDRTELIGMVHALQRQLQEFTSPEHMRLYQIGRLHAQNDPAPEEEDEEPRSLWERLSPRFAR
jgi:hypothetical protein